MIRELKTTSRERLENPVQIYNMVSQGFSREVILLIGYEAGVEIVVDERRRLQPEEMNTFLQLGAALENINPIRTFYKGVVMAEEQQGSIVFINDLMLERLSLARELLIDEDLTSVWKNWNLNHLTNASTDVLYQSWLLPFIPARQFNEVISKIEDYAMLLAEEFPGILHFIFYLKKDWGNVVNHLQHVENPFQLCYSFNSLNLDMESKLEKVNGNLWEWIGNVTFNHNNLYN
ncbi:uncharacterized protein LOC123258886 [Cotesia glomerata]|uniref:uncharacterized protein LOC123258886 n=1 Tax=Cotesia glomerata TaxID=32391 RepID=UPI001D02FCE1|nr:uncharacterized protein LOC123258886 [Cotesia glomerata]